MTDVRYWLWLSLRISPGSAASDLVLSHFDYDAKEVFKAKPEALHAIADLKPELADLLADKDLDETRDIYQWCIANNVGLLPYDSPLYPERLRRIPRAPLLLYYKGKLPNFDQNVCIATVGTRRMTEYGKRQGYVISRDLAIGGAIVVSGMALGIDTVCHRGSLDAGGHTVAVLGCGIDRVYPRENTELMEEIILNGTIFTEFKPGTAPIGSNFPIRNRIISGLSQGTLVIEADEKSGAMITARDALRQGRDIFALPGKVGEQNSYGTNSLIRDGAKMVTTAVDILEEYEYYYPHAIHIERLPAFMPRFSVNPIKKKAKVAAPSKPLAERKSRRSDEQDEPLMQPPELCSELPDPIEEPLETETTEQVEANENDLPQSTDWVGDEQLAILAAMPKGQPISPDELAKGGFAMAEILSAMTILEVAGLVAILPGGLYKRLR